MSSAVECLLHPQEAADSNPASRPSLSFDARMSISTIDGLKARCPHLFQSPEFWCSRWEHVVRQAESVACGQAQEIGESAGGRKIPAFFYGAFEPVSPTATISSAMASDRPGAFYAPSQRKTLSLALVGSIHGGETEGIACCLSLLRLLETGRDWQGHPRPALLDKMSRVRLSIVPCLNPDGRVAAGVDHLSGGELEDLFLVQQGLLSDGTLFRGRQIKETQPIPPGMLQFMGGYYNAAGVNLQHDDFLGPEIAPENRAIQKMFRREIPDAFLTMHAHGARAAFLAPDGLLPPGYQRKQTEAVGFILGEMHRQGMPFLASEDITAPPWSFYFQVWLHFMTGATPLLFEFSHGLAMQPASLGQIMETGYRVFEAWLDYNLAFSPRPATPDLFGATTPAA